MSKVFCEECKKEIKPKSKYKMIMKRKSAGRLPWGCYPYHLECYEQHLKSYSETERGRLRATLDEVTFSEKELKLPIYFLTVMMLLMNLLVFYISFIFKSFQLLQFISVNVVVVPLLILEIYPILKARRIRKLLE